MQASLEKYNSLVYSNISFYPCSKKLDFDFWNNTFHGTFHVVKTNSKRWRENHSKKCQIKLLANWLILESKTHKTGERNFYSEDNINKIKTVLEEYNEIYDFR